MNMIKACMLSGIFLLCLTSKLWAEFVSVVELTDLRGNASFQICTEEEKKKLETELKAEEKVFSKVLDQTKAEWKTMISNKSFPSSRIKQRTLRVMTTTSKREEAEAFMQKREAAEADVKARQRAEEESVLKKKPTKTTSRRGGGGNNNAAIAREQKEVKEDRAKDAEADKAEELLRKNLSAAAGHDVPFNGEVAPAKAAKKAPAKKKK